MHRVSVSVTKVASALRDFRQDIQGNGNITDFSDHGRVRVERGFEHLYKIKVFQQMSRKR